MCTTDGSTGVCVWSHLVWTAALLTPNHHTWNSDKGGHRTQGSVCPSDEKTHIRHTATQIQQARRWKNGKESCMLTHAHAQGHFPRDLRSTFLPFMPLLVSEHAKSTKYDWKLFTAFVPGQQDKQNGCFRETAWGADKGLLRYVT